MDNYISLDISKSNKVSDFGLQMDTSSTIYFGINDGIYNIDYSKFTRLNIVARYNNSTEINTFVLNSSDVIDFDKEKVVKWEVPMNLLDSETVLQLETKVTYEGKIYTLEQFKIVVYKVRDSNMNNILEAIKRYNTMLSKYYDKVKRTEVNQPLGVVGLDSNGKFDEKHLPTDIKEHMGHKLSDTLTKIESLHGLKLDKKTYQLQYWDTDDEEYYYANQVHGGQLGFPNKPTKYDIFGGNLELTSDTVDGMLFTEPLEDYYDGATIGDELDEFLVAGEITNVDMGEPIHGGFL